MHGDGWNKFDLKEACTLGGTRGTLRPAAERKG
jgi:hypothetical protein